MKIIQQPKAPRPNKWDTRVLKQKVWVKQATDKGTAEFTLLQQIPNSETLGRKFEFGNRKREKKKKI